METSTIVGLVVIGVLAIYIIAIFNKTGRIKKPF